MRHALNIKHKKNMVNQKKQCSQKLAPLRACTLCEPVQQAVLQSVYIQLSQTVQHTTCYYVLPLNYVLCIDLHYPDIIMYSI